MFGGAFIICGFSKSVLLLFRCWIPKLAEIISLQNKLILVLSSMAIKWFSVHSNNEWTPKNNVTTVKEWQQRGDKDVYINITWSHTLLLLKPCACLWSWVLALPLMVFFYLVSFFFKSSLSRNSNILLQDLLKQPLYIQNHFHSCVLYCREKKINP